MLILKYRLDIQTAAINHGLQPSLIAAICMTESSGDPWSMRFEPEWRYYLEVEEFARKSRVSVDTERAAQAFSYGLMHIIGSVGRQHSREEAASGEIPLLAPSDSLARLYSIGINLHYGCRHLKKFLDRLNQNELDAVAAYNAGWPRRTAGGDYVNQRYVDTVFEFKRELLELD